MSQCYNSYRKKNVLKTASYLLDQKCCDESSCSQLVDDLQDLQFKCNDIFRNSGVNSLEKDEKGNIEGTVCSLLRDKKSKILDSFKGGKVGRKKTRKQPRRKTIKERKQSKKTRRRRCVKKI